MRLLASLSALLWIVPTFVGISLAGFFISSLGGDALLASGDQSDGGARTVLSAQEIKLLREVEERHLPLFWNACVPTPSSAIRRWIRQALGDDDEAAEEACAVLSRLGRLAAVHAATELPDPGAAGDPRRLRLDRALATGVGEGTREDALLGSYWRRAAHAPSQRDVLDAIDGYCAALDSGDALLKQRREMDLRVLGGYAFIPFSERVLTAKGDLGTWSRALMDWWTRGRVQYPASPEADRSAADRSLERYLRSHRTSMEERGQFAHGLQSVTETRYARWLLGLVSGDFGDSWLYRRPISELLLERLGTTAILMGPAILLTFLAGVPLGLFLARRRGQRSDRVGSSVLSGIAAAPDFWVAASLMWLCHRVLPVQGLRSGEIQALLDSGTLGSLSLEALWDLARHLFLPVSVLVLGSVGVVARLCRAIFVEVLSEPWLLSVRARGLKEERVIRHHVMRPALASISALIGQAIPWLCAGSLIVESAFSIPGMGSMAYEAALASDVPLANAVMVVMAIASMIGTQGAELLEVWLDPRRRR